MEANGKVELGEELRPAGLTTSQDLGGGEIHQILVVSDHINRGSGAFKIMSPVLEGLEDGQQLLVMGVIVQLWSGHSP